MHVYALEHTNDGALLLAAWTKVETSRARTATETRIRDESVIVLQTSAASSPPIRENLPETSRGALPLSDLRESRVNRRDSLRNFILGLFTYYLHANKNSFGVSRSLVGFG